MMTTHSKTKKQTHTQTPRKDVSRCMGCDEASLHTHPETDDLNAITNSI